MTFNFNFISISDIHLGHPHTTAEYITDNLRRYLNDDLLSKVDAVFIGGDTFDKALLLGSSAAIISKRWMEDILRACKRHNVMLRVLEGTPSHDRDQAVHFIEINEMANIECDVRYINTLSIETFKAFGCTVLYVPDEWKPDTDDIWMDVKQELALNGIDQVDYAIMHGSFEYQLPPVAKSPKHKEERYLSIVKRLITIGHIHTASNVGRIYANGSFDRLSHGYETPKGFWLVESKGDKDTCTFIVNEFAKIYTSIDCRGLSLDEALTKISYVENVDNPPGSNFQIVANQDDPILGAIDTIKQKFIFYNWKVKKDDSGRKARVAAAITNSFTPISITPENIAGLLMKRMIQKNKDPTTINAAVALLENGGA